MKTYDKLKIIFEESYSLDKLVGTSVNDFKKNIKDRIGSIDSSIEGYIDPDKQRDLSIKFHWGHNHDFGNDFSIDGRMEDRHIRIVTKFIDDYGLPKDLNGKKILDIGVWTGGTSLLFASLGANVTALEEVVKYADTVNFLATSFGLTNNIKCHSLSLYEFLPTCADEFDYIIYSGVIYHVTDPLVSLRHVFSALKDGGKMFLETYGNDYKESMCLYEGPSYFYSGSAENLSRGGWNYYIPSSLCLKNWCMDAGFENINISELEDLRFFASADRKKFQDICRAGLSVKNIR